MTLAILFRGHINGSLFALAGSIYERGEDRDLLGVERAGDDKTSAVRGDCLAHRSEGHENNQL